MPKVTARVVAFVHDCLKAADPVAAERFNASFVIRDEDPQGQIRSLNRYWRSQLCKLKTDTFGARESLLDDCSVKEWERLFVNYVLPTVIQHQLPIV